jgi:hypothetical protein
MFDGARSFQQPATLKRFGLVLPFAPPTASAVPDAHGRRKARPRAHE